LNAIVGISSRSFSLPTADATTQKRMGSKALSAIYHIGQKPHQAQEEQAGDSAQRGESLGTQAGESLATAPKRM